MPSDLAVALCKHEGWDVLAYYFFFSSRRRHTRFDCDWSSDVCSSDLVAHAVEVAGVQQRDPGVQGGMDRGERSEEHSLNSSHSQISYAVFCLKKKQHGTGNRLDQ